MIACHAVLLDFSGALTSVWFGYLLYLCEMETKISMKTLKQNLEEV
jgi:hypothetical protein